MSISVYTCLPSCLFPNFFVAVTLAKIMFFEKAENATDYTVRHNDIWLSVWIRRQHLFPRFLFNIGDILFNLVLNAVYTRYYQHVGMKHLNIFKWNLFHPVGLTKKRTRCITPEKCKRPTLPIDVLHSLNLIINIKHTMSFVVANYVFVEINLLFN